MADPPDRSLQWRLRNDETVDSGVGINVRAMLDANLADDATQKWQATHTNDNVNRHFNPANGINTNAANTNTTLVRRGWAIPLTESTPTDTRCRMVLPAQTVSFNYAMSFDWSGDGPSGGSRPSALVSLWKYKPSDDTGTLIGSGTGTFAKNWGGVDSVARGSVQTVTVNVSISETVFERDEVLFAQVGSNTGTLANPLAGTTNYEATLWVGTATRTHMNLVTAMAAACTHDDIANGVGTPARFLLAGVDRGVSAMGTPSFGRLLEGFRAAEVAAIGSPSKTLQADHAAVATGVGDASEARIGLPIDELPVAGEGGGTVTVRKMFPVFS